MWVHLVIFIVAAGSAFAWKAGWLKLDGLADRESVRWFLIVAVCGNLVGMLLTLTSGSSEVYTNGYRLEKESTGAYTQEFQVAVNGEDTEKVEIQVPEKESEESPASEETVKEETPEESRKKNSGKLSRNITKKKRTRITIICRKNGMDRS